ncbi:L-rhamnose mutarotase, partial [Romboutsia ilealis]|nr:L-rhamnose mutarotase [Romboutsia ilealis]
DMAKMEADEVTRQWWKLTRPCFTEYSASSKEAFYEDMDQIFDFAE